MNIEPNQIHQRYLTFTPKIEVTEISYIAVLYASYYWKGIVRYSYVITLLA